MARLWLATILAALMAFLFYGAGCTRRSIDSVSDGGTSDGGPGNCAGLDELACGSTNGCVADYCYACACTPSFAACRRASDAQTTCPLYGCPQPLCDCGMLSENECISSESTLGCTPDYCPDCKGGQVYTGCSGPNSGGGACPASCPVETCHNDAECSNGEECVVPGASAGCGPCRVANSCVNDTSCAGGEICAFDPCICTNSGMGCIPGCSQTGCGEGEICGQSNHCLAQACLTANDCPAQFQCNQGSCIRRSCMSDSECSNGYCVKNQCYSTFGVCQFPPP